MAEPSADVHFLEALPRAAFLVTNDGTLVAANRRARSLLGLGSGEVSGASLVERVGAPATELRDRLRSCSRTREPLLFRLDFRAAEGGPRTLRCEGSVVRPWSADAGALILVRVRDREPGSSRFLVLKHQLDELNQEIAERRRTEARLEQSRTLLEEAQRLGQIGSWAWDIQEDAITWSDQLYRLFGLEPGSVELSYETYLEALPDDERERVNEIVERFYETREPFAFEHKVRRPDGEIRILSARGRVLTDESGRPVRMVGMAQDVTRRRRDEAAREALAEIGRLSTRQHDEPTLLREATRLLVGLLDEYCLALVRDEDGDHRGEIVRRGGDASGDAPTTRSVTAPEGELPPALTRVMSRGPGEVVADVDGAYLEQIAVDEGELAALREMEARSALALPLGGRDGTAFGVLALVSSTFRYTDKDLARIGELADRLALGIENVRLYRAASERAEREQRLRHKAEKEAALRDEMTTIVGHDLRNPLQSLSMAASILEADPSEARVEQQVGVIRRATSQMNRLIEDLLDVTRIEAGTLAVEPEPVPVRRLLDDAVSLFESQAAAKKQELVAEPPAGPGADGPVVLADRERIVQVLSNLLSNAIRHTPEGGRIELRAGATSDEVVEFAVADSGPGIDPDDVDRIFDRFWQSPREEPGRSGLGLTIARGIVEAHGGRLWVDSGGDGGAVLRFTLDGA